MRRAGHVARFEVIRNINLQSESLMGRQLGKRRHRLQDNIKRDLTEIS
jgi:hypothetical protein